MYLYSKDEENKEQEWLFWWKVMKQALSEWFWWLLKSQIFLSQQNQIICIQAFKKKSVKTDLNFDANSF